MPHPPTPGKRCAVEGCNAWAVRNQVYCAPHLHQYEDNVRLAVPDPEPRLVGPNRRLCRARSCKHLAMPNSHYCAEHAKQIKTGADTAQTIAAEFSSLLTHLTTAPPDCLTALQREMDMLTAARKILTAHAEMSSRSGWKAISSMTFIRLWLSSTAAANDLIKSRYVMENASGADVDRLLGGVYNRIDREPPAAQLPLPGQAALPGFEPSPAPANAARERGASPLTDPAQQLAEWFLEANDALGAGVVRQIMEASAQEGAADEPTCAALVAIAAALPARPPMQPPALAPDALASRLNTLSEIMQRSPDLARVSQIIASGGTRHAQP